MVMHRLYGLIGLLLLTAVVWANPLTSRRLLDDRFSDWVVLQGESTDTRINQIWRQPLKNLPKGADGYEMVSYQVQQADSLQDASQRAQALLEKKRFNEYRAQGYDVDMKTWSVAGQHTVQFLVHGLNHTTDEATAHSAEIYTFAMAQEKWVIWLEVRLVSTASELDVSDRSLQKTGGRAMAEELVNEVLALWTDRQPAPVAPTTPATPPPAATPPATQVAPVTPAAPVAPTTPATPPPAATPPATQVAPVTPAAPVVPTTPATPPPAATPPATQVAPVTPAAPVVPTTPATPPPAATPPAIQVAPVTPAAPVAPTTPATPPPATPPVTPAAPVAPTTPVTLPPAATPPATQVAPVTPVAPTTPVTLPPAATPPATQVAPVIPAAPVAPATPAPAATPPATQVAPVTPAAPVTPKTPATPPPAATPPVAPAIPATSATPATASIPLPAGQRWQTEDGLLTFFLPRWLERNRETTAPLHLYWFTERGHAFISGRELRQ